MYPRNALSVAAAAILMTLLLAESDARAVGLDKQALTERLHTESDNRAEMTKGLYEAVAAGEFPPPDCTAGAEMFDDVPASHSFCPFIEEMVRLGITAGCGGGNYCPDDPVTRGQMAVFVVAALATVKPANVITVAASGADYTAIQDAIDSITDADFSNRYLIDVAPGVYDESIFMKSWVSIRGAGVEATVIWPDEQTALAVVEGASRSEVRDLKIRCNSDQTAGCNAVHHSSTGRFILRDVAVSATKSINVGDSGTMRGVWNEGYMILDNVEITTTGGDTAIGILHEGNLLELQTSKVTASKINNVATAGQGMAFGLQSFGELRVAGTRVLADLASGNTGLELNGGSSGSSIRDSVFIGRFSTAANSGFGALVDGPVQVTFDNCQLEGIGGNFSAGLVTQDANSPPTVQLLHSRLAGADATIMTTTGAAVRTAHSHFVGGSVIGTGSTTCAYSTDGNYTAFTSTCP